MLQEGQTVGLTEVDKSEPSVQPRKKMPALVFPANTILGTLGAQSLTSVSVNMMAVAVTTANKSAGSVGKASRRKIIYSSTRIL